MQTTRACGPETRDPVAIDTGRDQPNADQIARNLAGTSSSAQATMGDTQTSYQILAGFDYPVSETVSVGLRARWMRSGEFAGTVVWDPLRSPCAESAARWQ